LAGKALRILADLYGSCAPKYFEGQVMKLEWEKDPFGNYIATDPAFETIYRVKAIKPFGPYAASGHAMDAVETETVADGFAAAQADFDARLAKCHPGYVMVPEEATGRMLVEMAEAEATSKHETPCCQMDDVYRAIIAAAKAEREG
jgi:hypothetical protein